MVIMLMTQLRETSRIECRYRDMQLTMETCIYENQGIFPSAINCKPPHLRGVPSSYNNIIYFLRHWHRSMPIQ